MKLWAAKQKGFTIVELLIVIVVIAILAAITIVAFNGIQARARDSQRLSDLNAIAKAIRLYQADNGQLPTGEQGTTNYNGRVGEGAGLDNLLKPYMNGQVPHDPAGPGDATHYYYYDGYHGCGGQGYVALLFARDMEESHDDGTPCTSYGGEGGSTSATAYHIVLGKVQ